MCVCVREGEGREQRLKSASDDAATSQQTTAGLLSRCACEWGGGCSFPRCAAQPCSSVTAIPELACSLPSRLGRKDKKQFESALQLSEPEMRPTVCRARAETAAPAQESLNGSLRHGGRKGDGEGGTQLHTRDTHHRSFTLTHTSGPQDERDRTRDLRTRQSPRGENEKRREGLGKEKKHKGYVAVLMKESQALESHPCARTAITATTKRSRRPEEAPSAARVAGQPVTMTTHTRKRHRGGQTQGRGWQDTAHGRVSVEREPAQKREDVEWGGGVGPVQRQNGSRHVKRWARSKGLERGRGAYCSGGCMR